MTTASHGFFEQLNDRGYEPLLAKATGTLCVELVDGGQSDQLLHHDHQGRGLRVA